MNKNVIRVGVGKDSVLVDLDAVARLPAGEQAKVAAELQAWEAKVQRNPLLRYRPSSCAPAVIDGKRVGHEPGTPCTPACEHAEMHRAVHTHPLRAMFGGNRAGKTTLGIADDIIQATPWDLLPEHLHEFKKWECPFYCRIVAPDMQRTMIPVIWEKLRDWLPKELLRDGSWDKSLDKTANCLRLECGCRFDFLSYEMDLNKFGGAALHRVHYDEEPPSGIRRECLMRLMDYNGDEILTMTPLSGVTWTYREIWKKKNDPNIFTKKIAVDSNPHVSHEAKLRILGAVADDQEYRARRYGDFISGENLVYPLWRDVLVDPMPWGAAFARTGGLGWGQGDEGWERVA